MLNFGEFLSNINSFIGAYVRFGRFINDGTTAKEKEIPMAVHLQQTSSAWEIECYSAAIRTAI